MRSAVVCCFNSTGSLLVESVIPEVTVTVVVAVVIVVVVAVVVIVVVVAVVVMGDYRYHELRPLISHFPCHWVVPVDFSNTCPMKIVRIFYRIIVRYGRDIYTLTQYFPNQQ